MADKRSTLKLPPMAAGQRYGRLIAINFTESRNGKTHWRFHCDCGRQTVANITNVRRGVTTSCGCRQREILKAAPGFQKTHGGTGSPEYKSWKSMWDRCTLPTHKAWKDYGGRGITICERWKQFENFRNDMGPRPLDMSLDRYPNKDGNYEPDNVRWATDNEQNRNKRTTRLISFRDQLMPIAEAAELAGLSLQRVKARLRNGWSAERALSEPLDKRFSRPQK